MTPATNNGHAAIETDAFPLDSFREASRHLRRPFTPAAVKFKPQTVLGKDGKGVLCVAYIDARLVIERLNLIILHLWEDQYRPIGNGQMWCDLTVDGITRSDVGEGQGKALVSDALKRAGVKFGIGVSLYAIPQQRIWKDDGAGKFVSIWSSGTKPNGDPKFDARIEDGGQAHLRRAYERWLAEHGSAAFGEALSHGDVEGAQGDHEADVPAGVDPQTGELVVVAPPVDGGDPEYVEQPDRIPAEYAAELAQVAQDAMAQNDWKAADIKLRLTAAGVTGSYHRVSDGIKLLTPAQAAEFASSLAREVAA